MKIKPRTWEFVGDFCCWEFQRRAELYPSVTTDGKDVYFGATVVTACPYCGKKIVLEKEMM